MSNVMNMKAYGTGGSGETGIAFIEANYPLGTICTATCNGTTLTSKGVNTSYLFLVPFAGTWEVTGINPDYEFSTRQVTVGNGDSVSITLIANNILYRNGDQYIDKTGGWSGNDITFENTYIVLPIKTSLVSPEVGTENEFTLKSLDGISITAEPAETGKTANLELHMVHNGISQFTAGMSFSFSSTHHYRTTSAVSGKIVINAREDSECDIRIKEVYQLIR